MVDQQIIEQRAIHEIEGIVSSDTRLRPELTMSDKIPYVDGTILVYKSEKRNNKNLDFQVSVQVKGTEKSSFDRNPSFTFKKDMLEYYSRNSGILFFVVSETAPYTTYYKAISPTQAKQILKLIKKKKKDQKSIALSLTRVNTKDIWKIVTSAHYTSQFFNSQTRIVSADSIGNLKNISVTIPVGESIQTALKKNQYILSGLLRSQIVAVDTADIIKIAVQNVLNITVIFPNQHAETGYIEWISDSSFNIIIGGFITLIFDTVKNQLDINWNFNFSDSIGWQKYCEKINMLKAMLEKQQLIFKSDSFSDGSSPFNFSFSKKIDTILKDINHRSENIKKIIWLEGVLGKSYYNQNLDVTSQKVLLNLLKLHPSEDFEEKVPFFIHESILDDNYYLTYENHTLKNVFSQDSPFRTERLTVSNSIDNKVFKQGNPLVLITEKVWTIPGYSTSTVLDNFILPKEKVPSWYENQVNQLVLSYIDAYDHTGENNWLYSAQKILKLNFVTDQELLAINSAQIEIRLLNGDIRSVSESMFSILENSQKPQYRAAAALMLNMVSKFSINWKQMTDDEKRGISKYPLKVLAGKEIKEIIESDNLN